MHGLLTWLSNTNRIKVQISCGHSGANWSPTQVRGVIPSKFYEANVALSIAAFLQCLLNEAAVILPCELLHSREGGTQWIAGEGVVNFECTEVHHLKELGFPADYVCFWTILYCLLLSLVKDDSNIAVHFHFMQPLLNSSNPLLCRPGEKNAFFWLSGTLFVPVTLVVLITLAAMCAWLSWAILLLCGGDVGQPDGIQPPLLEGFLLLAQQP